MMIYLPYFTNALKNSLSHARRIVDQPSLFTFRSVPLIFCMATVLTGCIGEQPLLRYEVIAPQLANSSWSSDCIAIEHTLSSSENNDIGFRVNLSETHDIKFLATNENHIGRLEITARTFPTENCSGESMTVVMTGSYRMDPQSTGSDSLLPEPIELTINGIHQSGTALANFLQLNASKNTAPVQFISWNADISETIAAKDNAVIMLGCEAPKHSMLIRLGRDAVNNALLEMPRMALGAGSNFYVNLFKDTATQCPETETIMPIMPELMDANTSINSDSASTSPTELNTTEESTSSDNTLFDDVLVPPPAAGTMPNTDPNNETVLVADPNNPSISDIGLAGVAQAEEALQNGVVNVIGEPPATETPITAPTVTPAVQPRDNNAVLQNYLRTLETPFVYYKRNP